jgi:hypothetical protein
MRTQQTLRTIQVFSAAAALVLSGAVTTICEARHLSPPTPETGYQAPLINRPACMGPAADNWPFCGTADPHARRIGAPFD